MATSDPDAAKQPLRDTALRAVDSRQLLGQHGQLIINHEGQLYYLRITSNNKLILTK